MILSWFSARERRRRAAAKWFVRMRGADAAALQPRFDRWMANRENAAAYERVARSFDAAALLRLSQPGAAPSSASDPEKSTNHGSAALAASIALALLVPAAWTLGLEGPWVRSPAMLMAATAVGEVRTIALADGSRILLDTDSAISYEEGQGPGRAILLRGRARFLAASPEQPFRVEAGSTTVEAGAAKFDMSLAGGGVSVASLEGVVLFEAGGTRARLAPGSAARAEGSKMRPSRLLDPGWPSGMLEFDNELLGSAVQRANRYSQTKIRIGEGDIARLRVSGAYRSGDVEGLARALASAFRLRTVRLPGGDLELRKNGS